MTLSPTATEALCITGDPRSGKTGALVERAVAWAETAPATPDAQPPLLFFCASPVTIDDAALRLSQRGLANVPVEAVGLAEPATCQHGPRTGLVTTPFDYACRILADPRAQRAIGRGGRVLSRAEEAVFYEDLKTCGLKRRRLRELWAFLQCGLANLNDGDPNWIQTTEERAILDLARDILAFEDAILPGEVVNLAVRALEVEPTLRQRFGSPVVLADDYLLMSRASQRLVNLLAADKIAVAGNEYDILPAFESYPCATGFAEFEETYSPLQRVTLEAPFPTVERSWKAAPDLSDEMRLIAQTIANELACGTDPHTIAVVGTNRTWRTNLQRALASVGIPAAPLGHPSLKAPKGNLASTSKEDRERVLRLLAVDHGNAIAWRQWLSFDDALGRSAAVSELRCVAQPQGLNLAEALAALDDDALPGLPAESPFAQSLLAPYREAQRLLGEEAPSVSPEPATHPTPAVAIAAPEDLFGHTFEVVIFGGFVNGFIPSRDMCDPGVIVGGARARQETTDRAAIALAEQRTTRRLLFTSFKSCDLETAERLRLHIPRIRLRSGVRTCNIEPSSYLEELNLGPKQTSGPTDQSHPSA
ncbi:hypothetical protein ADLECEL_01280 [Adlercreutzia equolifaciens subsp. celatus]|uniref:DNA helicase n=1 Tax=Adlercreutzia equolifaciens subsp. celatus DSM 18785 TaxID=1121021 RepID=A0A3N0AVV7_9ACTN|nr:hypothetical protein [Adlercreutzia equolifaciens]MCP2077081.1 hypothetical protein [Adlercreutzia equolifaciens subsp. celatus DSM 18785]RFT94444.1 hypothetical protein DX904_01900 [Adlercreutzia equolifaciens subsp. celatus]RNL38649.1 hypothetical protein DMP10_04130 [Adlercreutzia equolifaciens subsp. celatus DSM 18785]BCS56243.1 hypothetical protein ADLECEL_01280 [Adlercreutzia equolifaciens subsp. celatus]